MSSIFTTIWGYAYTLVAFFAALGILVLVHEWGHYIVAKLSGVWVEKFSIGFGPKIIGFSKNGTDYRIAPIPLGGYVKLYGQDPLEEAEGDLKKAEEIAKDPRSFHSKSLGKKLATVMAGPIMNFVLCLILMPLVYMIGIPQPKFMEEKPVVMDVLLDSPAALAGLKTGDEILEFGGSPVKNWQDLSKEIAIHPEETLTLKILREGQAQEVSVTITKDPDLDQPLGFLGIEPRYFFANEPIIDKVTEDSPAAAAGLKTGDKVVRLDGKEIKYWSLMTKQIQKSEGRPLEITVLRDGAEKTVTATPIENEQNKSWMLGIQLKIDESLFAKKRFGFLESLAMGTQRNIEFFGDTVKILSRLFTGNLSPKFLGGPIQIAQQTSAKAKEGLGEFLLLVSFLSMQLGILNLLPIPVLDGGHVVFMLIEALRRRPISPRVRHVSTQVGLAMLLGLMGIALFNDFNSIFHFSKLIESVTGKF